MVMRQLNWKFVFNGQVVYVFVALLMNEISSDRLNFQIQFTKRGNSSRKIKYSSRKRQHSISKIVMFSWNNSSNVLAKHGIHKKFHSY